MFSAFLPKLLSLHVLLRAWDPWFHEKKYSREASGSVGEESEEGGEEQGELLTLRGQGQGWHT